MAETKEKRWRRFRHRLGETRLACLCLFLFLRAMDALPLPVARWIGRMIGRVAYVLDRGHRAVCLENLAIAFPEKTAAERRSILKKSYVHLGLCLADFCHFWSMKPEDVRERWVVPEEGADARMQHALAQGQGLIAVAAHIGFWELSGFAFPPLGYPLVSVAREIRGAHIDALITRVRSRLGNAVVHQEGALRPMLRALQENKCIGVIMDQHAGRDAPMVSFFSRQASTVDTVARLHMRTGAPLLSNLMIRRADGRYTWRCRVLSIPPRGGESDEEYVKVVLRECNRDFEDAIREAPDQWLWMHKRWRQGGAGSADSPAPAPARKNSLQSDAQA
ncbi:MAG: hypothetical protein NTW87_20575 [Planctomycetota bacterium]|nr:hypothetical protein [Planctomycetota bacterium]